MYSLSFRISRTGFFLLGLVVFLATAEMRGQESGENQTTTASELGVLARLPRQILPPLDCLHCNGPPPMPYCLPGFGRRGYLYYGTYPLDDDWFNRFNDCPGGNCGNPGTVLGLGWIQLHNAHSGPVNRLHPRHAK